MKEEKLIIPKTNKKFRSISRMLRRRYLAAFLLITPALALRLFSSVYPILRTIYLSFLDYNPIVPVNQFTGVTNFTRISHDFIVHQSIFFTVLFTFSSIGIQLALGLIIALLLNAKFRLRQLARTINLIPWAIPMIVIAIGFRWMFDTNYGIINDLLSRLTGWHFAWLVDPWGAKIAVILTNCWKNAPFMAVLLLAGLQSIPLEIYEAAKVDGAGRIQSFRYITLPFITPLILTSIVFFTAWYLAAFDLIYGMTGGGPGFSTAVLAYKIFQESFTNLNFGYASAIGIVLFFLVSLGGLIGLFALRRQEITR